MGQGLTKFSNIYAQLKNIFAKPIFALNLKQALQNASKINFAYFINNNFKFAPNFNN